MESKKDITVSRMILLNVINFGLVAIWGFDGAAMPLFLTSKFDLTNSQISLILGIGKLMIALSLFFGLYSDFTKIRGEKRRPLMLIGGVACAPLIALIPHMPSVWALVADITLVYFFVQFASVPYYALIPEVIPNEKLGIGNAFFSAFSGLGTVVAYAALFAFVYKINKPMAFYLLAGLTLVCTLITYFTTHEFPDEKPAPAGGKWSAMARSVREIAVDLPRLPSLGWFMAVNLFFWAALGAFIVYFTKFMEYYVNIPGPRAGMVLGIIVIVTIVVSVPAGIIGDKYNRRFVCAFGMVVLFAGLLIGYFAIGPTSRASGYNLASSSQVAKLAGLYGVDMSGADLASFAHEAFQPPKDLNGDEMTDRKSDAMRWCLNGEFDAAECEKATLAVMGADNPALGTTCKSLAGLHARITAQTDKVLARSYLVITIAAIGLAICIIMMATILQTLIPEEKMGLYMGLYSTFTGIGQYVSLVIAGIVIDKTVAAHVDAIGYRWIFIQGAALMGVAALILARFVPYVPNAKDPTVSDLIRDGKAPR